MNISITGSSSVSETNGTFSLVNDSTSTGNSKYYGTDGNGTKGFHDLPSGGSSGGGYVNRGNPDHADFTVNSFTCNASWHDLDLSSIVPAGAKAVDLALILNDDSLATSISFRPNGVTNEFNLKTCVVQRINSANYYPLVVGMDDNRVIEYDASNTTFTTVNLTVCGWWF